MPISVHFAHITDVHISERDKSWSTVVTLAPDLLRESFDHLNQIDDLDFVFLTGDMLDTGTRTEAEAYNRIVATLEKPWHFVPGNHDGYVDPGYPDALNPEDAVMLIDPRMGQERIPTAQRSFWSRTIKPGVQLIGLDSRLAEDWAGMIDRPQLEWLAGQLELHRDDLVIIGIHHPIYPLGPHNARARFPKFICLNGPEIEALLDKYPNVKMTVSGHHHANHLSYGNEGHRLRVCTTALSGYQCIYRTIRITETDNGWRVQVVSHEIGGPEVVQIAYQVAMKDLMAHEYDETDPTSWVRFCAGRPEDLTLDAVLP